MASKLGWGLLLGGAALWLFGKSKSDGRSGGDGGGSGNGDDTSGAPSTLGQAKAMLCRDPKNISASMTTQIRDSIVKPIWALERAKFGAVLSAQQKQILVETVAAQAAKKCRSATFGPADPELLEVLQGIANGLWIAETGQSGL